MLKSTSPIQQVRGIVEVTDLRGKKTKHKFDHALVVGADEKEVRRNFRYVDVFFRKADFSQREKAKELDKSGRARLVSVEIVKCIGHTNSTNVEKNT